MRKNSGQIILIFILIEVYGLTQIQEEVMISVSVLFLACCDKTVPPSVGIDYKKSILVQHKKHLGGGIVTATLYIICSVNET